ncbi:MAG: hypothetical protein Ta2B_00510 [Termitinemataceae bacterium]|nr:MAG: hypothetical protein Ta2B_00510 [Termitinemataceae bacterium]
MINSNLENTTGARGSPHIFFVIYYPIKLKDPDGRITLRYDDGAGMGNSLSSMGNPIIVTPLGGGLTSLQTTHRQGIATYQGWPGFSTPATKVDTGVTIGIGLLGLIHGLLGSLSSYMSVVAGRASSTDVSATDYTSGPEEFAKMTSIEQTFIYDLSSALRKSGLETSLNLHDVTSGTVENMEIQNFESRTLEDIKKIAEDVKASKELYKNVQIDIQ